MALPDDWSLVTVTGKYTNLDGTPALGSILFHSDQVVVIGGVTVVPRTTVVPLEPDGTFIAQLPSTNDPGLSITGWAYRVVENITNGRAPYFVFLQHEGGPYDMATIDHVVPPDQLLSTRGQAGKSAYETAVDNGFVGTEGEWLLSMQGDPGADGASAYEVAVANGFVGTEAEWLASLVGETGADGPSAYEVAVANGYLNSETEWLLSLKGDPGDPGADGDSGYTVAVNNGFVGTEAEWLLSIRGDDGASAYDTAVANGFIGTSAEWVASLQGTSAYATAVANGFVGTEAEWVASIPGKSAYQSALDSGFVGTEAEWIASIPGEDGAPGNSAYAIALNNGFVGSEVDWLASLVGEAGASAYAIAVANGFVGTQAEWVASLKGDPGDDGAPGNTILSGTGAPAPSLGVDGNYYINYADHDIYGPKTAGSWGSPTSLIGPPGSLESLGPEILSAFPTGWDTTGTTPPTVDGSGAHFVGASSLASARFVTTAIAPNTEYEVVFTVANYSAGAAVAVLCSEDGSFGQLGTQRTANGTYTERLITNFGVGLGDQIRIRTVGTGTFDITSFSVKEVITGSIGGSTGDFIQSGANAATRTQQNKDRDWVSIKDFLLPAHGTNYSPALVNAMAAHDCIYFPPGNYTFNTAVALPDDKILFGGAGRNGVRITANNGFLYNTSATVRKSIFLSNMTVNGNGTAIAISGPFGGRIENVAFDGFTKCIENAFGFLIQFQRCSFRNAAYGIHIAVSNGVVVNDCFFAADCPIAFDTVTLPASDVSGGGYTGSLPMIFSNNNVNQGNAGGTGVTSCRFSGIFVGFGNYFEDYSTGITGNVFVEYEVHRFADGSFRWHTNEMNGQGNGIHAVRLVGSAPQACNANGEITGNRFIGFTSAPVRCGDAAGANNYIQKLRVFDNNNDTVSNMNPRGIYRPMVDCGFDTVVSITGADVVLPIAQDVHFDNCDGVVAAGNIARPRKTGAYEVTATVDLRTTASNYNNTIVWLEVNDVEVCRIQTGTQFMTGGGRNSCSLGFLKNLVDGDSITLHAGNGDTATRGRLRFKWAGNGHQ